MKDIQPIEFFTPQQAADMLQFTPSTLRKYCGLITKHHGKEYFKRDATNARIFTRHDVDLLKRIANLKKAPNVTLDSAVLIALSEITAAHSMTPETPADTNGVTVHLPDIAAIQYAIIQKNDQIQQLMAINQQLIQSNEQLSKNVQDLLNRLEATDKETPPAPENKSSLFKKLFNRP